MHNQALIAAAVAAFQQGDLARARLIAEKQLAEREHPLLHHLIGLIDCRLGRFETGIERLKRAMAGDPGKPSYRVILARALIDAGRAPEALEVADAPSGDSAEEMEVWHVRAEAAFYSGDRATEATAWRAICEARPQDPTAWANLGRSLVAQFSFADAEAAYRKALALTPALPIRHELGLLLERSNQLEKLGLLLDAALADGIPKGKLADLWALRALRAGDIVEACRVSEMIDIRPDPFRLNGLKAKIAEAADRPAEAFAAATAMNWSMDSPGEWRALGRAYRDELRARERAIAEWPHELPRLLESARRNPVFLVGFPRSGTTLADTFLRGHPEVRVVEEELLLEQAAQALGGVAKLPSVTPEQLASAREGYFAGLDERIDPAFGGLVVDKMPLNMLSLPLIDSLFPDARIMFAQRHPCDCVLSGFMQAFVLNNAMASFSDLGDAADLYDAAMSLFVRARDRLNADLYTLVYEDLVTDPEAALRPLTEFLGLDWHEKLLDHRATAARRDAIRTPSYDSVTQPLSERPSGRWRRYEALMTSVLPVLMPWARRLGYAD